MKLKKEFITYEMDGKQIMVASSGRLFSGLVKSNSSAAFIVDQLKKETTKDMILTAMKERYDASEEILSEDIDKVLNTLRGIGALDE